MSGRLVAAKVQPAPGGARKRNRVRAPTSLAGVRCILDHSPCPPERIEFRYDRSHGPHAIRLLLFGHLQGLGKTTGRLLDLVRVHHQRTAELLRRSREPAEYQHAALVVSR